MKLLEALAEVGQSDLDEIVAEITTLEAKISQLREVRKIIEIKLGVVAPRVANFKGWRGRRKTIHTDTQPAQQPSQQTTEPENAPRTAAQLTVTDQYRIDAKRYIMANGPAKVARIAQQCGIPMGSVTALFKHKWFRMTEHGVDLTPEAFKA